LGANVTRAEAAKTKPVRAISFARRALWHINRSPLRHGVKAIVTARNRAAVRERERLAAGIPVSEALRAGARSLRTDGYVMLDHIVEKSLAEEMAVNAAGKLARADELAATQHSTHKNFWVRLLDEDMRDGMMDVDSVYVRFAMQPAVIALLAAYYGEVPILDYTLLTVSRESKGDLAYSQFWHRDHDDVRTVKLFAYLTDVADRDDGPFTFLPGAASDRFGFSLKSHLPDDRVFGRASRNDVIEVIAPRLTTFMVETSRCLHMGSRMAPGHVRLLYTATFISAPRMYPSGAPKFRASRKLSELERKLLDI
jgi:hypothetical protein